MRALWLSKKNYISRHHAASWLDALTRVLLAALAVILNWKTNHADERGY